MDIQLKTGCFDDAALVRRVVFMDEVLACRPHKGLALQILIAARRHRQARPSGFGAMGSG